MKKDTSKTIIRKGLLLVAILAAAAFCVDCGVGVDGDPSWTAGDTTSGDSLLVTATVTLPSTTSVSISKDLDLAVGKASAAGYLAVAENFITGEVCGTATIEDDGSAEVLCDEAKGRDPDDPTTARLVLKAVEPGGLATDEGVVEKYFQNQISDGEMAAGAVTMEEMMALQFLRAQLGIDKSASSSSTARDMLKNNTFQPNCFKDVISGLVTSSAASDSNLTMAGAVGGMKEGLNCLMSRGVGPKAFGFDSYPEMFRSAAKGEMSDTTIANLASAIGSASCGITADTFRQRTESARDTMSALGRVTAGQIAEDSVTCGFVATNENEKSAWIEGYKAIEPTRIKESTFETTDAANMKLLMEAARTAGDYAAFDSVRAKLTAAACGATNFVEMAPAAKEAAIEAMRKMISSADLSNVTDCKGLGQTYGGLITASSGNTSAYTAMINDPIMYSNYIKDQLVSGTDSHIIAINSGNIYQTMQTNYESMKSCMANYGGSYNSGCFREYSVTEISGALSVTSVFPVNSSVNAAINGALSATFSKKVGSITTATFTVKRTGDGSAVAGGVSVSDKTATFVPSSSLAFNTQYMATLTTGIKDITGADLQADYSWTFTTTNEPDTTPPTVLSTSPANGATNGGITGVSATFNEAISASTLTASTFTLTTGGSPVAGTVSLSGVTATFTPSTNLAYSTSYTATITTGVKDLSDNALAANYSWTFTTRGAPGTLDTSFGTGGKVTTAMSTGADSVVGVVVQSDGKIVTAGLATNTTSDFAIARYNSNGSLDTTFGTGGKVTTDINNGADWPAALLIQSDGKYVEIGRAGNATWDFGLVRYNTDGSLDTTFGTGGKVSTAISTTANDQPIAAAIQSDGKILAGGWVTSGANTVAALVRYNTDGSLDTTFDSDGIVTTSTGSGQNTQIYGLAVQSDGKIVGGGLSRNGTSSQLTFVILRYNADGSLDTTFDSDGIVTTDIENATADYANSVAIQPDGKIVAAGQAKSPTDFAVIRYNTDGSLDTSFGTAGIVTTAIGGGADVARAVKIQSDGKIVLAGSANNGTNDDFALVRYNSNGSLDSTFGTGGKVTTAIGNAADVINRAMQIQTDGKIIVGGKSNNGTNDDFALARYWP